MCHRYVYTSIFGLTYFDVQSTAHGQEKCGLFLMRQTLMRGSMESLSRELLVCAPLVQQSNRKLVRRKFRPYTNISTNHRTVLCCDWLKHLTKVKISVALDFRQTVIRSCSSQKFSGLVSIVDFSSIPSILIRVGSNLISTGFSRSGLDK